MVKGFGVQPQWKAVADIGNSVEEVGQLHECKSGALRHLHDTKLSTLRGLKEKSLRSTCWYQSCHLVDCHNVPANFVSEDQIEPPNLTASHYPR